MATNGNSGVYHQTSVDAIKAAYTTIAIAGHKRTHDNELKDKDAPLQVLGVDVTNRRDFKRLSLKINHPEGLKASEIGNITFQSQGRTEYSQRRALALTPAPSADPYLHLSHPCYGLPAALVNNFAALGISSIYPWQSKCLQGRGILSGEKNLVYSAPTGGGKSLIADVLMLKHVIENPEKKALLVLPYVALVQEKLRWLRRAVDGINKDSTDSSSKQRPSLWRKRGDENSVRVVGFFGGSKSKATWADMDIAVCTIEKANSLVNTAIDDGSVGSIGVVVIDELHMIDDDHRGYVLELIGTKLLSLEQDVQIIGMSATLQNPQVLAAWLNDAKHYASYYRPVPIEEYLVFENVIYPASTASGFYKTATQLSNSQAQGQHGSQRKPEPCRLIECSEHKELKNPVLNSVVSLANETARAGYGALVFCCSRIGCEADALLISQVLPHPTELDSATMEKRHDLLHNLRSLSTGLDRVLEKTLPYGVAFHHAGLTVEERDIIATAYDNGVVKVVVATCSLAAGINLPARRVILHGARMGPELVGPAMLRQMRGRAGRKGKDEIGETYLCCQKSDLEAVTELMQADLPNIESCLLPGKRGIKRALLEVVATKLAKSVEAVDDYVKKTLLYHSIDRDELAQMVKSTLQELKNDKLIACDSESTFEATLLGEAITALSLTPEDGLFIYRELRKALQAFVMDGEMHILYTLTPLQAVQSKVDWQIFRKEMDILDESSLRVMGFVGIKPSVVSKMAQGGSIKESTLEEQETARIYKRFYTALQLRDLCNEIPIHAVARKYDLPRGSIQNLAQTCHGFAAGMIKFCERMGWGTLVAVLDHYSDRLKAGAKSDLLALAEITYVKSRTARIFWENGFKSVGQVAAADVKELLPILLLAQPRKLRLDVEDEKKYHQKLLLKAEIISKSANRIWERRMREEIDVE